jgi:hypothetical protein
MSRLAALTALLLATAAMPAQGVDWGQGGDWDVEYGDMRGSFFNEPKDWSGLGDEDDSIGLEFGLRYSYTWGAQNFSINGGAVETNDNTHMGELFMRIDDAASRAYVKGNIGYSIAISGDYSTPTSTGTTIGGQVGYGTADVGWYAFGDGKSGIGLLAGYQFWNDSPRTERDNYAIIGSLGYNEDTGDWWVGADGVERNVQIHAVRLGVSGRAELGEMFDLSGEIAAIPYANLSGVMGGGINGSGPFGGPGCNVLPPGGCAPVGPITTSPIGIEGWGYGGAAEVEAGFSPFENLRFSVGGRAWYLQGSYDATYSAAYVTAPQRQPDVPDDSDPPVMIPPDPLYSPPTALNEDYIDTNNPFSMMRYGIFAGVSYSF